MTSRYTPPSSPDRRPLGKRFASALSGAAPTAAPTAPTDRDRALALAADPTPSTAERGPVARLHWRHAIHVDKTLADITVRDPATNPNHVTRSDEWPALLAETHAALLDPKAMTPLATPSPVGTSVLDALRATPHWPTLCDAALAHPMIARETVTALAPTITAALEKAGATSTTDGRKALADLAAARAAVERARAAATTARNAANADQTPAHKDALRDAMRADVEAQQQEERAKAALNAAQGVANRAGTTLATQSDTTLARLAKAAQEKADALNAYNTMVGDAGVGTGSGSPTTGAVSDDVLRMITSIPNLAALLRQVGALRKSLAHGRGSRHVRGREGMVGVTTGGLAHASDFSALTLAGLGGALGPAYAALTRLAVVEDRASVIEKGGGKANHGDLVLVLDHSGSMGGIRDGIRARWTAALALAILLEARRDDRRVGVVTYDGRVHFADVVDSPHAFAAALKAILTTECGDNNERLALTAAGKLLQRMPHGGDPADVLMITDGQWLASNLDGVPGLDRARLRCCVIGGAAPVDVRFASVWSVDPQGQHDTVQITEAATIAQSVV